jgi:hypothetical protein
MKAKYDFGDDAEIFIDELTSPLDAYIELYSQYGLPDNCERYLSTYGCIYRAIADKNLHAVGELASKILLGPNVSYSLSLQRNYIEGVLALGDRVDTSFTMGYLGQIGPDIVRTAYGASYADRVEFLSQILPKIPPESLLTVARFAGKGNATNVFNYLNEIIRVNNLIDSPVAIDIYAEYFSGLFMNQGRAAISYIQQHKIKFEPSIKFMNEIIKSGYPDIETIKYFLDSGLRPNEVSVNISINEYRFDLVKLFLDNSDLDPTKFLGLAMYTENMYLFKWLVKRADVNKWVKEEGKKLSRDKRAFLSKDAGKALFSLVSAGDSSLMNEFVSELIR